jgi:hypothetical protein
MVPQLAETAESDLRVSSGQPSRHFSDWCASLTGRSWTLAVRVIAVTLLCSGSASASPLSAGANNAPEEEIAIEIIPRGAAYKSPSKSKQPKTSASAKSNSSPKTPSTKSALAGRGQPSTKPSSAWEDPKPFHLHSQAAANATQSDTDNSQHTTEPLEERVSAVASQAPAGSSVAERAERSNSEPRTPQVAAQEFAVPLIKLVEPPAYVRAGQSPTGTAASASNPPAPLELWKPLRPEERAEPLLRNSFQPNTSTAIANYGGNSIADNLSSPAELAKPHELEEQGAAVAETRVTAPEPRRPDIRKPTTGIAAPRAPGASHSLFATRRPTSPIGNRPVATVSRAQVSAAGHETARPPYGTPMQPPTRPPVTAPQPPAALAVGRYGNHPILQTPRQNSPTAAPGSRYGMAPPVVAHSAARASMPARHTQQPDAANAPTRPASHSILHPATPPRQTR